jgi:hypothetical protein
MTFHDLQQDLKGVIAADIDFKCLLTKSSAKE